ncbi:unnamed protein product [Acanthoscelides obtectus]|uniref:Pre-C2HC domain-containing protein n=1 Tax=Acanthoscelides obtectus TaxID=200917 RepID=A0A9P0M0F8_ACAOB|nr:unnamed protein product [Acanthoscelides obtectus]CAK1678081.1 hypothetical protein AOBTE_LOCUS31746 [Acanthoscelides obtectus]
MGYLAGMTSLGIRIERAVAVDAGIRIIPKTEDDYRRIIRLFKEENIPHHTFPLPTERNNHAVIRGIPASTTEQEVKGELEQKGYAPFHIIRLKRNGGVPMPLMVVILPKTEKSQQVFNEHELLGLSIRVEVQKNSRLIGRTPPLPIGLSNIIANHLKATQGIKMRSLIIRGQNGIPTRSAPHRSAPQATHNKT